ncbi:MAG: hypothetical protein HQK50_01455 [Oligoflexia bacterium]|nr:hypothetical protein [Oligoflexia bacterium]MBF0364204.1 hypothetical protein [Oligoflexia bacterium]
MKNLKTITMTSVLFLVLVSMLTLNSAYARDFSITKTGKFNVTKDALLSIMTDYQNFGQGSQHKYHLSGIDEIKVVKVIDDHHYYTWININDIRNYYYFDYVTITKEASSGKITVTSVKPDTTTAKALQKELNLPYKPFFSHSTVVWTIEEQHDQNGKFIYSLVTYNGHFTASGFGVNLVATIINSNLHKTATELFSAFGEELL